MVDTAATVIQDALTELIAQEAEQDIDPFEFQRGVRFLNRMMAKWAADEITLGYTEVSSPDDVITVPAGALEGIVSNLALRLAPALDIVPTQELRESAAEGYETIVDIGFSIGKANFPGNLPIGSGNEDAINGYNGQNFYPDCCEDTNEC